MEVVMDHKLKLPNGKLLQPGVEFTAWLPTRTRRGKGRRRRARLAYATHGASSAAGHVGDIYVSGREVGNNTRSAHTVWASEIITVHKTMTPELPRDWAKPRARRGR
jgi:hypothetical protein